MADSNEPVFRDRTLQDSISAAAKVPLPPGSWHDRSEPPPPPSQCQLLWASDGEFVWLIFNEGRISDAALLVRWWTAALVPAPPRIDGTV